MSLKKKNSTYPLQNCFLVVTPFHEENNLPTGVAVDRIDLSFKKPEEAIHNIIHLECMMRTL